MADDHFDLEPVSQSGPEGSEETKYQNRDPVTTKFEPSPAGIGHDQPDPFRHLEQPK